MASTRKTAAHRRPAKRKSAKHTTRAKTPRARTAHSGTSRTRGATPARRWSKRVTETSDAMDLEPSVFKRGPRAIALSLKRSVERSKRRKSPAYRSAMSMLTFYENRAGRNLTATQRKTLERAKEELRKLFGRE